MNPEEVKNNKYIKNIKVTIRYYMELHFKAQFNQI